MNRLLILSCSQTKRAESELLPAYERYDGPPYRLLRRYLKASTNIPKIKILSAEYGLISHDTQIPYYERQMTDRRAQELRPQVHEALKILLKPNSRNKTQGVFIYLGKDYLKTLEGSKLYSTKGTVKVAEGTPGEKLTDLYCWLYGEPPSTKRHILVKETKGNIQIRGSKIELKKKEVIDIVREAVNNLKEGWPNYHSWYVVIDRHRVSPKWIINLVTGLPLNSFHTHEAWRVLSQLGIPVYPNKI
ncbi:MAG: hypothetical protein M3247_07930 [Thermoproteota archaeon]|nr:hypothetical protein [Acidobacteriota bacterium]MDQ3903552.1 hypothetical protein [Thermoproteota archaeon]